MEIFCSNGCNVFILTTKTYHFYISLHKHVSLHAMPVIRITFSPNNYNFGNHVFVVSSSASDSHGGEKRMHAGLIILITAAVSTVLIIGVVGAYKYWQKKKREQDQARFLKLFEDGDDIEDELGLGTII